MNGYKKEETKRDQCKIHSAKSDREPFRVCPSKLSKRELEDLYFAVLENNVELKRTINSQQEKIKTLSTKVQRMTVTHRPTPGRENECCSYIKAMVNEQKQSIADLKKANERLSERVRILNMRLCSAKQFLKRSPAASMSRCAKCCAPPVSLKNSSVSVLHTRANDSNAKSAGVSSQYLNLDDKDVKLSTRSVETETVDGQEKENTEKLCDENKYRSLIEELKKKIVDLQEELSKSHEEYSSRITRLEEEVVDLRIEKDHSQSERASSAQQLQLRADQADQLAARLRTAEAKYGELAMELSIEKRKVAELETRVKAVDISCAVAKTIEEHFSNACELKQEQPQLDVYVSPFLSPRDKPSDRLEVPGETRGLASDATDDNKVSKVSDDSGFIADSPIADRNNREMATIEEELSDRIAFLQDQLNMLKLSAMQPEVKDGVKRIPSKASSPRMSIDPNLTEVDVFSKNASEIAPTLKSESYVIQKPLKEDQDATKRNAGESKDYKGACSVSINTGLRLKFCDDDSKLKETKEAFQRAQSPSRRQRDSNLQDVLAAQRAGAGKSDAHNSMQIPGPLPVGDVTRTPSKFSERLRRKQSSKDKLRRSKSSKRDSTDSTMSHVRQVVSLDAEPMEEDNYTISTFNGPLPIATEYNRNNLFLGASSSNVGPSVIKSSLAPKKPDDLVEVAEGAATPLLADYKEVDAETLISEPALVEKYMNDDNFEVSPAEDTAVQSKVKETVREEEVQPAEASQQIVLCGRVARACTCEGARPRAGLVPGAPPAPPAPPAGCCGCAPPRTGRDEDTQTEQGPLANEDCFRQRSATYSKDTPQTYSVPPRSPDNTDCEISTLTDLPLEKDGKSPRVLSPGEEKQTSTYTDTYSAPTTTEFGTLSEGELPGAGGERRLSLGESKVGFQKANEASGTMTRRMEEALHAISQELARCRDLLQARTPQKLCKDASMMAEASPAPIALRRAAAAPRLGDAPATKCVFTLHVGTVVLSDEAVLNSRNMSLVLTWKFYDQNVTMTRMKAGRVMLFDFSTEYDLKMTDQFLNYMKHDEMQLLICELDNQCEPFASCALRLRDALLHTNRRADMSLALMAGPQLRQARAARDDLDSSDEVGVLDLWCMLRVDPALLPAINRAIAKTSNSHSQDECMSAGHGSRRASYMSRGSIGRYMAEVTDEDHSIDHLSQDLDLNVTSHKYDIDSRPVPDNNSVGSQTKPVAFTGFSTSRLMPTTSNFGQQTRRSSFKGKRDNMQADADRDSDLRPRRPSSTPKRDGPRTSFSANLEDKMDTPRLSFSSKLGNGLGRLSPPLIRDDIMQERRRTTLPVQSDFGLHRLRPPAGAKTDAEVRRSSIAREPYENIKYLGRSILQRNSIDTPVAEFAMSKMLDDNITLENRGQVGFKQGSDIRSNTSKIFINEVTGKNRSPYEVKQALDASQDAVSQTHSVGSSWRGLVTRRVIPKSKRKSSNASVKIDDKENKSTFPSFFKYYTRENSAKRTSKCTKGFPAPVKRPSVEIPEPTELTRAHRTENTSKKSVTYTNWEKENTVYYDRDPSDDQVGQTIELTVMWLALNEECSAMSNPAVQRLYVAYAFLGRSGADLETPVSLPKPASYVDKCYFQFTKTFQLNDCDLPLLGHMAKCRSTKKTKHDPKDCIVFTVISEPPEDPLGLDSCEDIGYAYLYLGDLIEYSAGSDTYTEVIPVLSAKENEAVCGVLSIKVDGLDVLRHCTALADSYRELPVTAHK